jgi:hypothetical protein
MRGLIRYQNIPVEEGTAQVQYGRNSLFLAPEDPAAFLRNLMQRVLLCG